MGTCQIWLAWHKLERVRLQKNNIKGINCCVISHVNTTGGPWCLRSCIPTMVIIFAAALFSLFRLHVHDGYAQGVCPRGMYARGVCMPEGYVCPSTSISPTLSRNWNYDPPAEHGVLVVKEPCCLFVLAVHVSIMSDLTTYVISSIGLIGLQLCE